MTTTFDILKHSYKRKGEVVSSLPVGNPIRDEALFFISSNDTTYLTHGIHKYATKFIPHIPRWALTDFLMRRGRRPDQIQVLDPFSGSGTTLLEALILGIPAVGIDVDPLSLAISTAKCTLIPVAELQDARDQIQKKLPKVTGNFAPAIPNLTHWFSPDCITKLSRLHRTLETVKISDQTRNFLLVTLSSVIRKVSNADDRSLKTYVSHTHIKTPPDPIVHFFRALERNCERMQKLHEVAKSNPTPKLPVMPIDSTRLTSKQLQASGLPESYDLVVTSPPYIKSMDYTYYQMLELFWIGPKLGLKDRAAINSYKARYVGTQKINGRIQELTRATVLGESRLLEKTVSAISKHRMQHALVVQLYFLDMYNHFEAMHSVLKKGGEYVLVVGNSSVSGIDIPTKDILIELAEKVGFKLRQKFQYVIRKHHMIFPRNGGGFIPTDWVICFSKK